MLWDGSAPEVEIRRLLLAGSLMSWHHRGFAACLQGSDSFAEQGLQSEGIMESMDKLIMAGKLEAGVAASVHGQLNFAQGQYMGAPLKPAMKFLSEVAAKGLVE